ncbi:MAG: hypothetical protein BMS9Abin30_1010 [Gammaproteobacteria bacterium]|nr:MAG: hypothetical protein BMS9Abin30_1010 [Gammaproteobacteria bacterium]
MVSFRERHGLFLRPRLKRLQEMQEEIYRQLLLLIPDYAVHYDSFQSRVSGSPLLRMDILERHPYTHFLRLTYEFEENEQRELSPDAHIRMYQDARLAEVTSFNPEQGCKRLAHPWYPHYQLFQRTWRQNLALDKWLGYLLHQGHSVVTMQPAGDKIGVKHAMPVAEVTST